MVMHSWRISTQLRMDSEGVFFVAGWLVMEDMILLLAFHLRYDRHV